MYLWRTVTILRCMTTDQLGAKLGDVIRKGRLELDLTQEGLAEVLGIPITTYRKIERGETDIKLPALQRLAEQFGTTVSKLVAAAEEAGSASAVSHPRASRRNVVTNVVRPARTAGR